MYKLNIIGVLWPEIYKLQVGRKISKIFKKRE
jgi:hypothetical protein